jgi:hypothetical protein
VEITWSGDSADLPQPTVTASLFDIRPVSSARPPTSTADRVEASMLVDTGPSPA